MSDWRCDWNQKKKHKKNRIWDDAIWIVYLLYFACSIVDRTSSEYATAFIDKYICCNDTKWRHFPRPESKSEMFFAQNGDDPNTKCNRMIHIWISITVSDFSYCSSLKCILILLLFFLSFRKLYAKCCKMCQTKMVKCDVTNK